MTSEWTFSVTFESDTQQPETIRGEVTGSLSAAVGRAVRVARQQKPTRNFYESVVVLVQKRRREARTETSEGKRRRAASREYAASERTP